MQRPMTVPVIVQVELHGLVHPIDALGKQVLNAGIFGERNVRALIEYETAVRERSRVAAVISILVVHNRRDAFVVKPVRRPVTTHSAAQDDYIRHQKSPE